MLKGTPKEARSFSLLLTESLLFLKSKANDVSMVDSKDRCQFPNVDTPTSIVQDTHQRRAGAGALALGLDGDKVLRKPEEMWKGLCSLSRSLLWLWVQKNSIIKIFE